MPITKVNSLSITYPLAFSAGTAALPSITTSGDTNTGAFFPAADTIGFTEGGTEAMRITSDGRLGIGTTTPSFLLTVAGLSSTGIVVRAGTYTTGSTTPSVLSISYLGIVNSSSTTITNFTDGSEGQIIYLYFQDSNTTINRNNCVLAGGVNFTSTVGDMLVLIKLSSYWYEICRSVNA